MTKSTQSSSSGRGHIGLMLLGVFLAILSAPFMHVVRPALWMRWRAWVRRLARVDEFMTRNRPVANTSA